MGARGPAAKAPDQRRNRVKPAAPEVEIKADAVDATPAPELPAGNWHPHVIRWWQAWTNTPAARLFTTTEWERLLRALPVCQNYWHAVDQGEAPAIFAAHKALLDAEKGLPATDYERRRAGIHLKQSTAAAPAVQSSAPVVRLQVV